MNAIKNILTPDATDRRQLREIANGVKIAGKVVATAVLLFVVLSLACSVFGMMIAGDVADKGMTAIWSKP